MREIVCRHCDKSFHNLVEEDAIRVTTITYAHNYLQFKDMDWFNPISFVLVVFQSIPHIEIVELDPHTQKFNPEKPNGAMFRLKDYYRRYGWHSFAEYDWTTGPQLVCPQCGSLYQDFLGRMIIRESQPVEIQEFKDELNKALNPNQVSQKYESKGRYKCKYCSYRSETPIELAHHSRKEHSAKKRLAMDTI